MAYVLAQASINDPASPLASLILQGGAFGLICFIVMYLYPKESRLAREERASRDKMFVDLTNLLQDKFEHRNDKLIRAIREQTADIIKANHDNTAKIEKALETVCKAK